MSGTEDSSAEGKETADLPPITGLHHVTAIATDPAPNVEFYTGVLGLRLVKRTVNFDDPTTYHLYYGDELGRPGTVLTFFPWPGARRGSRGVGQTTAIAFSVPTGSLERWREKLQREEIPVEEQKRRFDGEVLTFLGPDGLLLELVASEGDDPRLPWSGSPVPEERAIRGLAGVTLSEEGFEATARVLAEVMGFDLVAEEGRRSRFEAGTGGPGAIVDVRCVPTAPSGRVAAGTVHHVAFRVEDDAAQRAWRARLVEGGLDVTRVIDREYFRSIYFREPGGVLFEIATEPPGFTVDEEADELGSGLRLPAWLEPQRERIERSLPPLHGV